MTYLASSVLGLMIFVHLATFVQNNIIVRTAPRKHKGRAQSSYLLPCITLPKIERIGKGHGNLPATVAPPASSACLIQDPIGLVEPIQYPTP